MLSKEVNIYKQGSKMQNMYYRVANSYLKGYSNQPQSMNIVGSSVKNKYNYLMSSPEQMDLTGPAASYFKAPLKPRYITQATKIDQLKLKMMSKNGTASSSILNSPIMNKDEVHPLLNSRPVMMMPTSNSTSNLLQQ